MADTKKENPEWVKELNSFLDEFKKKFPEAKVNILAGDGTGYMCVIDDPDVWAEGLFSALMDAPILILPTMDAVQHAFEKMKEAVNEMKGGNTHPIVIRPNQVKS